MKTYGLIFILIIITVTVSLSKSSKVEKVNNNEFNLIITIPTKKLKYSIYKSLEQYYIHRNISATIVSLNERNELTNGLAIKWDVQDNGTLYVFEIGDYYWSDGKKITPIQIAENIFINNKHDKYLILGSLIKENNGRKDVHVIGNKIFVRLKNQTNKLLYYLTLPENGLNRWDLIDKTQALSPNIPSSGLYRLTYIDEKNIRLSKNKYNQSTNKKSPDEITFSYTESADEVLDKIKNKKIDFLEAKTSDVLNEYPKKHYNKYIGSHDMLVTIQAREITKNQKIAINVLSRYLDRSKFVKNTNKIESRNLKLLSELSSYNGIEKINKKEAVNALNNKIIEVPFLVHKDITEEFIQELEIIRSEARKIGIRVKFEYTEKYYADLRSGEEYSLIFREMGTYSPDDANLLNSYFCVGYDPFKIFSDLICENVKKALNYSLSEEIRKKNLKEAYEKILNSGYMVPLYFKPRQFLIKNKWENKYINKFSPYLDFNKIVPK